MQKYEVWESGNGFWSLDPASRSYCLPRDPNVVSAILPDDEASSDSNELLTCFAGSPRNCRLSFHRICRDGGGSGGMKEEEEFYCLLKRS